MTVYLEQFFGEPVKDEWGQTFTHKHPDDTIKPNDTFYADRLRTEFGEKSNDVSKEVFGNAGQYWTSRSREDIEKYLRMLLERPNIVLTSVREKEQWNGYPSTSFWVYDPDKSTRK